MTAILNIDPEAARDLEDNFVTVLGREMEDRRAREIARRLVERLDLCGYRIGREDPHQVEEEPAIEIDFEGEDGAWSVQQVIGDQATRPALLDRAAAVNDA